LLKRNTVDVDGKVFVDAEGKLRRVLGFVGRCPFSQTLRYRVSPSLNGYHVEFWCTLNCSLCRFVFDDVKRYVFDLRRPPWTRDVLWSSKVFCKLGRTLRVEAGVWVEVS